MNKTLFATISFILFTFFLIFVAKSDESKVVEEKNLKIFSKEFSGKAKVIDGDSIIVGKKEVRLLEIDAPEYKQSCLNNDGVEYNCGRMSFHYLRDWVNKKHVHCRYEKKDIYNRYLAQCYLGQISINENLLENGMAVIYNYYSSSEKLIELEKIAKKNKKGIWRGSFELPRHYRKRNKRK